MLISFVAAEAFAITPSASLSIDQGNTAGNLGPTWLGTSSTNPTLGALYGQIWAGNPVERWSPGLQGQALPSALTMSPTMWYRNGFLSAGFGKLNSIRTLPTSSAIVEHHKKVEQCRQKP